MSGLFIPLSLNHFSNSYIDIEAASLPKTKSRITSNNKFINGALKFYYNLFEVKQLELDGMPSLEAFCSIFRGYVCPLALKISLISPGIKILFSLSWSQTMVIWAIFSVRCMINPNSEMKQKASSLVKVQKILHKTVWAGTIITNFFYAFAIPSSINIASAVVMCATPLLYSYNDNALIDYISETAKHSERHEAPEAIFASMKQLTVDLGQPGRLWRMLKFRILHCIPALAIIILYALAPLHTDPLKSTLVTLTLFSVGYTAFQNITDVISTMLTLQTQNKLLKRSFFN